MRPEHAITWTGERWECVCGFTSEHDKTAEMHYFRSAGNGMTGGASTFQMEA